MRGNYFVKLIKYIKNVYHIEMQIEYATDDRVNPTYKTPQIISLVLTGFLLRVQSFNQLNHMIESAEFNSLKLNNKAVPKIDSIRNSLKSVDLNCLRKINNYIIKKTVRNKSLDSSVTSIGIVPEFTIPFIFSLSIWVIMPWKKAGPPLPSP